MMVGCWKKFNMDSYFYYIFRTVVLYTFATVYSTGCIVVCLT